MFFLIFLIALVSANSEGLVHMNEESFNKHKGTNKKILIKFYTEWCGHCKRIEPIYQQLAEKMRDNDDVIIGEIDCDENKDFCISKGVRGYPTILLFEGESEEGKKYKGPRAVIELERFVLGK